jgi:hypothetical protein
VRRAETVVVILALLALAATGPDVGKALSVEVVMGQAIAGA